MELESLAESDHAEDDTPAYTTTTIQLKNVGICTRKRCRRSIKKRLPEIRPPHSKVTERWNIKALPTDWVSVPKPSRVINNLQKSRQERHENVIISMTLQFEAINSDIESQFRESAEVIKKNFLIAEQDARNYIFSVDENHFNRIGKESFEKIGVQITSIYEGYQCQLDKFYIFLHELEKLRSQEYKNVLQGAYKMLHEISYVLPYDLQLYFEKQIMAYNEVLLSNLRCYAELELSLNLQAENSNRLMFQQLDNIKIKWRDYKKRNALIQLNERKLLKSNCESIMLHTEQGKQAREQFNNKEQLIGESWKNISPFPITSENVTEWSQEMQNKVNDLDGSAKTLIDLYKLAIVQVFEGYFDDLQDLQNAMVETGLADFAELSALSAEVCKPTIENVKRMYSDELISLQNLWDSILGILKDKLQTTFVFLQEAAHLWDSHFSRLEESQRIVLLDLQKLINSNDKTCRNHEKFVNIVIDSLRQAPDAKILERRLADVDRLLVARRTLYDNHYMNEVNVIEKYKTLVSQEIEVLVSELTLFLEVNYKDLSSTAQNQRASQIELQDYMNTNVLPNQMKQCEYQVEAVQNWMLGLWEVIERYLYNCKDEITQQANNWVQDYSERVSKRYEFKNAFHITRYRRLRVSVYEIRQLELKKHTSRIDRHKAGVVNEINLLRENSSYYEKQFENAILAYRSKIISIEKKRQLANNVNMIKSFLCQFVSASKVGIEQYQNISRDQQNFCENKLYEIRHSSVLCAKSIKLFIENGNFDYEEGKIIVDDLKKFDKIVIKKYSAVIKEIQSREKKLYKQLETMRAKINESFQNELDEWTLNEFAVEKN